MKDERFTSLPSLVVRLDTPDPPARESLLAALAKFFRLPICDFVELDNGEFAFEFPNGIRTNVGHFHNWGVTDGINIKCRLAESRLLWIEMNRRQWPVVKRCLLALTGCREFGA